MVSGAAGPVPTACHAVIHRGLSGLLARSKPVPAAAVWKAVGRAKASVPDLGSSLLGEGLSHACHCLFSPCALERRDVSGLVGQGRLPEEVGERERSSVGFLEGSQAHTPVASTAWSPGRGSCRPLGRSRSVLARPVCGITVFPAQTRHREGEELKPESSLSGAPPPPPPSSV